MQGDSKKPRDRQDRWIRQGFRDDMIAAADQQGETGDQRCMGAGRHHHIAWADIDVALLQPCCPHLPIGGRSSRRPIVEKVQPCGILLNVVKHIVEVRERMHPWRFRDMHLQHVGFGVKNTGQAGLPACRIAKIAPSPHFAA